MKFIHYKCVKLWVQQHLIYRAELNYISYYWKTFECEICKSPYPFCISHKGISYPLTSVKKPEGECFIMLESLNKDKAAARTIHVLKVAVDKNNFIIGRGHEADIRIADISVSRQHAKLRVTEQKQLILEDLSSKFGTLVFLRNSITLKPFEPKSVQVGRTLLWISQEAISPPNFQLIK